jgi:hypothetical protein
VAKKKFNPSPQTLIFQLVYTSVGPSLYSKIVFNRYYAFSPKHLFWRSSNGPCATEGCSYTVVNNVQVEMAVREWLRKQVPNFYPEGISIFVTRWGKNASICLGIKLMLKNNDTSVELRHRLALQ